MIHPIPRPVPKPWGAMSPAFKARYVTVGTVEWEARCACGSGQLVTWTADRDGRPPVDCTCTCNAQEGAA